MTERTPYGHLSKTELTQKLMEILQRNAKQRATIQRLRIKCEELKAMARQ